MLSKLWPIQQADLSILLTAMVTPDDPFQDPAIFGRPRRTELGRGRFQPARTQDVIMPADGAPVDLQNQGWFVASAYGSVHAHLRAQPDPLIQTRMAFHGFPPLGRLSYTIEIAKLQNSKPSLLHFWPRCNTRSGFGTTETHDKRSGRREWLVQSGH